MREPTTHDIGEALGRAHTLMQKNQDWDVIRALAESTTTATCNGVEGFRVFAAVRKAVEDTLPKGVTLPDLTKKARREQMAAVQQARMVVTS